HTTAIVYLHSLFAIPPPTQIYTLSLHDALPILGRPFIAAKLENGDTRKQLLARSRYILFKKKDNWTSSQIWRAEILFRLYPQLEKAYELSQRLGEPCKRSEEHTSELQSRENLVC